MAEFTHKGVKIELTPTGQFVALVHGKRTTCHSLDAMKKRIDKKPAFEPFKALVMETYRHQFQERLIVALKASRKSYGASRYWVDEHDNQLASVYKDTPENRARMTELFALLKANNEARERMRQEEISAREALELMSASEHA